MEDALPGQDMLVDTDDQLVDGELLVRGGNPKACYINFKIHSLKQQGRSMTFGELNVQRKLLAQEFDRRPGLQLRWKTLYQEQ